MISKGLFGKKLLDIQERVRQVEGPTGDQVLVKVRACGVCGTDVNFVRDWNDDPCPWATRSPVRSWRREKTWRALVPGTG